jgi:DNA adenine methylase
MKQISPVIKWFGSKRSVALELSEKMKLSETYFEPFVGGGAMMPFSKSKYGVANDIIPELVNLWEQIKINPKQVSEEYRKRWNDLQERGYMVYYEIRDNFNATRNCFDFLFITRTCVNGMIRYNDNGDFNNSFHLSRPGIHPDRLEKIIFEWSKYIQKFHFMNVDYKECLEGVKKGDFVFLDPPYGGTKDRYTKIEFNLNDFYLELEKLNSKGAFWMLTFDGSAGDRVYNFAPPVELYKSKFSIKTGLSSFKKIMEKKKDSITESVYLNYEAGKVQLDLFDV